WEVVRVDVLYIPLSTPLEGALASGVVDEDSTHGLRSRSEEMSAIAPVRSLPCANQAQIRLVDQRRCLERLARFFVSQLLRGELAQLVVHQGEQFLGGVRVAVFDGGEDASDFGHCG